MENEFPFIVAITKHYLVDNQQMNYICTGSLISKNDVLTSEHCMEGHHLTGIRVIVGSSYLNHGSVYYPEWWITYDQWAVYNGRTIEHEVNDIAILNVIIIKNNYYKNPLNFV
jgi:V8-like Glu-specific endopeptidase